MPSSPTPADREVAHPLLLRKESKLPLPSERLIKLVLMKIPHKTFNLEILDLNVK